MFRYFISKYSKVLRIFKSLKVSILFLSLTCACHYSRQLSDASSDRRLAFWQRAFSMFDSKWKRTKPFHTWSRPHVVAFRFPAPILHDFRGKREIAKRIRTQKPGRLRMIAESWLTIGKMFFRLGGSNKMQGPGIEWSRHRQCKRLLVPKYTVNHWMKFMSRFWKYAF